MGLIPFPLDPTNCFPGTEADPAPGKDNTGRAVYPVFAIVVTGLAGIDPEVDGVKGLKGCLTAPFGLLADVVGGLTIEGVFILVALPIAGGIAVEFELLEVNVEDEGGRGAIEDMLAPGPIPP